MGIDGEGNRRMGILSLLYNRRRTNPEAPGMSLLEFETLMSFPREHLVFTLWYLKEKSYCDAGRKRLYYLRRWCGLCRFAPT